MKKIFKNSIVFFFGEALKGGTAILLIPLYARYLTTSEYGIVAMISLAIMLLSTMLNMGQVNAVMRFFFSCKDLAERRAVISSVWFFLIAVSFIFAAGFSFFGKNLFQTVFPQIAFYPYGLLLIWIVFLSTFELIPFILLKAEEKALSFSLLSFFGFLARTSIIIMFVAVYKKGAVGKITGDLIYLALASFVFIYIMRPYITFKFSPKIIKKTLVFGIPLILHQLSLWIINLSDRVCLQYFTSLSLVGIYSIGYNLVMIINLISSSIGMAWTPYFFKGAKNEDARQQFARMSTYYAVIVAFCVLCMMVLAKEFVLVLTTSAYFRAASIIPVVAVGYFFHALYKISVRALSYVKRTKEISLCTVFSACLNISLNILWIPKYGMIGAAWATMISFLMLFLSSFYYMQKYYHVPFEHVRISKIVVVSGLIYGSSRFITGDSWILIFFLKIIVLCFYPVGFILFKFFTIDEKKLIWKKLSLKFSFVNSF